MASRRLGLAGLVSAPMRAAIFAVFASPLLASEVVANPVGTRPNKTNPGAAKAGPAATKAGTGKAAGRSPKGKPAPTRASAAAVKGPKAAPVERVAPPETSAPLDPETLRRVRAQIFSGFRAPLRGRAQAVGEYSNGCLVGGVPLPPSGPGFETMRRSRNRFFAHPEMIKFVRRFARILRRERLGPLIVGDLSQARGGPSPSGHRSHQNGLDADIGFRPPASLPKRMKAKHRETLPAAIMIDMQTRTFTPDWSDRVVALLEHASKDEAVDRIFVNPLIKFELCVSRPRDQDTSWLRKLRPWWGHHDHLHVRLRCPDKDTTCVPQGPLPEGDGCNEVAWWFSEEAAQVAKGKYDKEKPPPPPPPMPELCEQLAAEPALAGGAGRGR